MHSHFADGFFFYRKVSTLEIIAFISHLLDYKIDSKIHGCFGCFILGDTKKYKFMIQIDKISIYGDEKIKNLCKSFIGLRSGNYYYNNKKQIHEISWPGPQCLIM